MDITLIDESPILKSSSLVDEKFEHIDLTSKKSSIEDIEAKEGEFEVKEVESLELVVEKETSTEDNPSFVESKAELPLEKQDEPVLEQSNLQIVDKENSQVEYEVQKIVGHSLYKGKVTRYEIKWKGYPAEENTMERAAIIHDDVPELCFDYWNSINVSRPYNVPDEVSVQIKKGEESLKKRHIEEEHDSAVKKVKKDIGVPEYMVELGYKFPKKDVDWTQEIKKLTVQASLNDTSIIHAYIEWQDNTKTIHDIHDVHENIPKKLLAYYEERLQFK